MQFQQYCGELWHMTLRWDNQLLQIQSIIFMDVSDIFRIFRAIQMSGHNNNAIK